MDAAAIGMTFPAAYYALVTRGALREGETVLVQGASGGVGSASVQLARALGARVLATASGPGAADLVLGLGAEAVIDFRIKDVPARVHELTDGGGVDLIHELVLSVNLPADVRMVAKGGRIVGTGQGPEPDMATAPIGEALSKDVSVLFIPWGPLQAAILSRGVLARRYAVLWPASIPSREPPGKAGGDDGERAQSRKRLGAKAERHAEPCGPADGQRRWRVRRVATNGATLLGQVGAGQPCPREAGPVHTRHGACPRHQITAGASVCAQIVRFPILCLTPHDGGGTIATPPVARRRRNHDQAGALRTPRRHGVGRLRLRWRWGWDLQPAAERPGGHEPRPLAHGAAWDFQFFWGLSTDPEGFVPVQYYAELTPPTRSGSPPSPSTSRPRGRSTTPPAGSSCRAGA